MVLSLALGQGALAWAGSPDEQALTLPPQTAPGQAYLLAPINDGQTVNTHAKAKKNREPNAGPSITLWQRLSNCLHDHGLGCESHHNSPGCGSCKAECIFIFGSCREFFGEPCFPRPQKLGQNGDNGLQRQGCACP
jgi:hypothetical protein